MLFCFAVLINFDHAIEGTEMAYNIFGPVHIQKYADILLFI